VTRLTSHDTTPDFLEKKENLIDIIRIQIWIYESKGLFRGKDRVSGEKERCGVCPGRHDARM
jgi:hypothetical protein